MSRLLFLVILAIPLSLHADDSLVARVNGVAITSQEVDLAVDAMIPGRTFHGTLSHEKRAEFRRQAYEELVDRELQYQDARADGMKPDKKLVKQQMEAIRDRYRSRKDFERALSEAAMTEDGLRHRVEKEVLVSQAITVKVTEPSRMTDAAVKEHYDKNSSMFMQPESVRLRIITTKSEKNANEALSRLKAGEDFGAVAARISEDNFRIKGGDIGYVHRGRLLPAIETAAFSMKKGEVNGPIKADDLLFIIKVEDQKPAHMMTYEEVKEKLKKELEAKQARQLKEAWLSRLRDKAVIELLDKSLKN